MRKKEGRDLRETVSAKAPKHPEPDDDEE